MSRAIHTTAGNYVGRKSRRGFEQYETPPCATEALLQVEPLPSAISEPCAGSGNIVAVLKAHGHHVVANDIAADNVDFRLRREAPPCVEAIVTNSPFNSATDFVCNGLALVQKVAILERIQFLESNRRAALFDSRTLVRVLVLRNRVPRMHRSDWEGRHASPAMTLAWFVFDRDHDGSAPTRVITMSGGRASRQKGTRAERIVVRLLQEYGFAADRVPLSGAARGRIGGDISVPLLGIDRRVEVKARANGFRRLYDWLDGVDVLIVCADCSEPLVVVPMKFAAQIAAIAEKNFKKFLHEQEDSPEIPAK